MSFPGPVPGMPYAASARREGWRWGGCRSSRRGSRRFGPVVEVDRMTRETIRNDKEKAAFARVQGEGRAGSDPRRDDAGRAVEDVWRASDPDQHVEARGDREHGCGTHPAGGLIPGRGTRRGARSCIRRPGSGFSTFRAGANGIADILRTIPVFAAWVPERRYRG